MKDAPLVNCPSCATEFDVSTCPPFSTVACPSCEETTRVRQRIQHYEIKREIGRGGMSRVFLARDTSLDRKVALKVLLDQFNHDDDRLKQFEKEAQTTASFAHPHVVKVYAVGRDLGNLFIVMELVENGNLDERVANLGKVPERQALTWAHETAQGLQAAYQNGLIHRDVKPGNILLAQDHSAKLVDFGLALMFQREVDESEDVWATPYYVSPEKLLGEPEDHRSDIYSLGATLYHLLVGKPSFEVVTGSYEELHAAKTQPVPMKALMAEASSSTCALIQRMMAVSPDERPPNYEALLDEIENAQSGGANGNAGERFLARQRTTQNRNRIKPWIAATAVLAMIGAGILWFQKRQASPSGPPEPASSALEPISSSADATLFSESRAQLLAGKLKLASDGFRTVFDAEDTSTGVRQWALYHGALCHLLQGNESESKKIFRSLEAFEGPRQDLNQFFRTLSETMLDPGPVSKQVAEATPEGFCHPLALLAYGLKNWHLGKFTEAHAHWQRFTETPPGSDFQWIANYPPLIRDHLEDLNNLQTLGNTTTPTTLEATKKSIAVVSKDQTQANTRKARDILTKRHARLKKQLEELTRALPSTDEREGSSWQTLRQELQPLAETFQFSRGVTLLKDQSSAFPSERGQEILADHLHLWMAADRFMQHLVENLAGAEGPIRQRNGNRVQGKVTVMSLEQISVQLASGEISIPLKSVNPWSLARFARKDLNDVTDANLYYQRLEQLVAFAHLTDLSKVERNQASLLSRENRPFRERWTRWQAFLETQATPSP